MFKLNPGYVCNIYTPRSSRTEDGEPVNMVVEVYRVIEGQAGFGPIYHIEHFITVPLDLDDINQVGGLIEKVNSTIKEFENKPS